jgi:hypothetical protein
VVAVIMPNDPGIRNVAWQTYATTVDAVEALSGYDLLALLPDPIEIAVESNTKPPSAVADGPYASLPHLPISMSAAASSDPDGDVLRYEWAFGDGSNASGVAVTHAYANPGTFTVRLIVTDARGLADTTFAAAIIIAPSQAITDAGLLVNDLVHSDRLDVRDAKWLANKFDVAAKLLYRSLGTAAVNQLQEIAQRVDRGDLNVPELAGAVHRLIASLTS